MEASFSDIDQRDDHSYNHDRITDIIACGGFALTLGLTVGGMLGHQPAVAISGAFVLRLVYPFVIPITE